MAQLWLVWRINSHGLYIDDTDILYQLTVEGGVLSIGLT